MSYESGDDVLKKCYRARARASASASARDSNGIDRTNRESLSKFEHGSQPQPQPQSQRHWACSVYRVSLFRR